MAHARWITSDFRKQCAEEGHVWGDTVEDIECGDDRCGVQCTRCEYIEWYCKEN